MLTSAGFADITIEEMPVEWSYGSFDESWNFMTQVAGAMAAAVKELPPDDVEKLRSTLATNVETFRTDSGITLPGVTVNVSAS